MKKIVLLIFLITSLFASINDKSAMLYYGKNISYTMAGIHDYIIVQPDNINSYRHGFKLYKNKMYAYVSIGEIHNDIKEYQFIKKEWIVAENKEWKSEVLDIKNREYQQFLFEKMIEPLRKRGFKNFFFDTLDSYQIAAKTNAERKEAQKALAYFINSFHKKYPESKLIINRGFEIIDEVHDAINAVLFESYYQNANYKKVSDQDRKWLDIQIKKIKSYNLDVISVEYAKADEVQKSQDIVQKILAKNMIPYVSNRDLTLYGLSSKNAIKREILTLMDESTYDRSLLAPHQYGALPIEYQGYIEKLHDINKGLPKINEIRHYAGVVIWLRSYYKHPKALIEWVQKVKKLGIKIAFIDNFGIPYASDTFYKLGVEIYDDMKRNTKILYQDKMIGFESAPTLTTSYNQVKSKNAKALLVYENSDKTTSNPAAITPWGGYAVQSACMNSMMGDDMWVVNPFRFFKEALRLQTIPVPDPTTENGKRLFFAHLDGDAIMNEVEGKRDMLSGESIYKNILLKFHVPQSMSIVGAEVLKEGMYPKLSERLEKDVRKIYSLDNVEAATHTFSHPFKWGRIKNGNLDKKYRLNVPNYKFSLDRELAGSLKDVNSFLPEGKKKSRLIFWSGDCTPREDVLEYTYKHHFFNINGGDTTITNSSPWLGKIAPLGLQRGLFYQIYTGAENENVYTNDWHGPFWGYKRAIQTFKLTNSPRRVKPIDIYFHFYVGSKTASIHALQDVFTWALSQDVMPIYTSEYIPKVMDYFEVSMAHDNDEYLIEGMKDLKTLRLEGREVDLKKSPSVVGMNRFESHTYVSLDTASRHKIKLGSDDKTTSYLISSNGEVKYHRFDGKNRKLYLVAYVPMKVKLFVADGCNVNTQPRDSNTTVEGNIYSLDFQEAKKSIININCN